MFGEITMKKQIPEKVANKIYDKLLSKNQNRTLDDWVETVLYKPGTNEISNRFFKNSVSRYIYKCKCDWCLSGKCHSTRKRWENTQEQLNDYI